MTTGGRLLRNSSLCVSRILIGDGDLRGPSNELCNLHDNNWQSDDESSESWAYVIMNPSETMILCNRWYYAGTIL